MTALPPATERPCGDCPWRRKSVRGWLGPLPVDQWVALVFSDEPIACHETITVDEEWAPGTLQCRGAATFRANIGKLPRDAALVVGPRDRDVVFSSPAEFREHHDSPLADWLAEQRGDEVRSEKLS